MRTLAFTCMHSRLGGDAHAAGMGSLDEVVAAAPQGGSPDAGDEDVQGGQERDLSHAWCVCVCVCVCVCMHAHTHACMCVIGLFLSPLLVSCTCL